MATIQINALNPAGSDLFSDDESYLKELTDAEMSIEGGVGPLFSLTVFISILTLRAC
jgi:hypothetical protein